MDASFPVDTAVLLGGVLLVAGVFGNALTSRYRVPSLLLFIGLGMLVADDGLALIRFDDARLAQNIAAVALAVILFEGGLTASPRSFRQAGAQALSLATIGVVVTAGVVALGARYLLDLDTTTAILLGAVVSSTDAAAVFAALRDEPLPERTRSILQLESGMNDPVAVMLTVGMVEVWRSDPTVPDWLGFVAIQLLGGAVVGIGVGLAARWTIGHLSAEVLAPFTVFTVAVGAISYGTSTLIGASGFLSIYLTGAVLAVDRRPVRGVLTFHEGIAATAQAVLFLLLGLLVFPSELADDLGEAALLTAVLVLVARPAAVHLVLAAFRVPFKEAVLVAWSGLRGAVPVVMATIPLTAGHPDGVLIFDIAFVVVLISVAIQAPTVSIVARQLQLEPGPSAAVTLELVPLDALDADVAELTIREGAGVLGVPLRRVPLPDESRIVVVTRGDRTFVPDGETELEVDDRLLVVVPQHADLAHLETWCAATAPDD